MYEYYVFPKLEHKILYLALLLIFGIFLSLNTLWNLIFNGWMIFHYKYISWFINKLPSVPLHIFTPSCYLFPLAEHIGCFHFPASLAVWLGPGDWVPASGIWVQVTGPGLKANPYHPSSLSSAAAAALEAACSRWHGYNTEAASIFESPLGGEKSIHLAPDFNLSEKQSSVCSWA